MIISARVGLGDLAGPQIADRQDQRRHGAAGMAPSAQGVDTAHERKSEIQHDRIEIDGVAEEVPLPAVERRFASRLRRVPR
ncbi:MAG TPA: hypothetical protein VFL49_07985 [Pseudolabrys sp.]|nr:hypothetical protein [Pseudolabrys sp.]